MTNSYPSHIFATGPMTSIARYTAWIGLTAILLLTFVPPALRPYFSVPHMLEHFASFLLVGGAFALGYPRREFGIAVAAFPFIAVTELLQFAVPGRHARVSDFVVNLLGVYAGIAIALLVTRMRRAGRRVC